MMLGLFFFSISSEGKVVWDEVLACFRPGVTTQNPSQAHQNTLEAMFFNSLNHVVGTSRLKATRGGKGWGDKTLVKAYWRY